MNICNFFIENIWIWSMFSAIGTISASVIALWLAWRGNRKKLDIDFIVKKDNSYSFWIKVLNPSACNICIESIILEYGGIEIGKINIKNEDRIFDKSVINAYSEHYIQVYMNDLNVFDKTQKSDFKSEINKILNTNINEVLVTTIIDINNKKYKSKRCISKNELFNKIFTNGLHESAHEGLFEKNVNNNLV